MGIANKITEKIQEGGFFYALKIIWDRLWENITIGIGKVLFCLCRTENIIVIESHNDFDCNGGAFYNFILKNNINSKWTIVWLVRNEIPSNLPENVLAFNYWKKNLRKEYYIHKAKYILVDDKFIPKRNKKQIEIYCQHGLSIKNVKGKINAPQYVDYIISSSKNYDKMLCENISVAFPNSKMLHFGYPYNDVLFETFDDEKKKITNECFSKTILWMPTFRKKDDHRNDSYSEFPLGVPLIMSIDALIGLNTYLQRIGCLLIIKIHPMQSKDTYKDLKSLSNIKVIDGYEVKRLDIDNYRLMKSCDALISDYSSSAYSYLLLNRPIGFVLSDVNEYKIGFSVDNYDDYMPGEKLYSIEDLKQFIDNLYQGIDLYYEKREALINFLYENKDGKSCERLAEFLQLL